MVSYRMKRLVTALDIGERWLKLAQAEETAKGKRIKKLVIRKIDSTSEENISRSLSSLLGSLKIIPHHLAISVPRHLTTVRFLKLPSTDEGEIRQMVQFQAERQIPYPKEEVIADYKIIDTDTQGYTNLMLVIAHRDVLNHLLNILKNANLHPQRFVLSSEAIYNWYLFRQSQTDKEVVAIIDGDTANTEIIISKGKSIRFTRSVSIGRAQFQESPEAIYKLIAEIGSSFATYQEEEKEGRITKIVLSGDTPRAEELSTALNTSFSLPLEIIEPLKDIPLDKDLSILPPYRELSLSAVLGLVLDDKIKMNLLPPELQKKRLFEEKRKEILLTTLFLSLLAMIWLGIFTKKIYDKKFILRQLDKNLAQVSTVAENLEITIRKVKAIEEHLNRKNSSIEILRELHSILPDGVSLTNLIFEDEDSVILRGTSKVMSDVFRLVGTLENLPCFKNCEVRYATKSKSKLGEFTDFEIYCPLEQ